MKGRWNITWAGILGVIEYHDDGTYAHYNGKFLYRGFWEQHAPDRIDAVEVVDGERIPYSITFWFMGQRLASGVTSSDFRFMNNIPVELAKR